MTAINIIRQKNAVHMITDAAGYDERGVLLTIGPKAWPLPHLNAVFAARGPKLLSPLIADMLAQSATSYDALKGEFADIVISGCGRLGLVDDQAPFQLAVAGWSESHGPDSYVLTNHPGQADIKPWTVAQCGPISIAPSTEAMHAVFLEKVVGATAIDALDPETTALKLIALQRHAKVSVLNGSPDDLFFLVGGFAQITTVTPGGISTRILHRWPDKLGETIVPERA